MISKWLIISLLLFSFLGFVDATYLTVKHYSGGPLSCNFLKGCDTVTSSPYSTIIGLPVALFGTGYYLTVFILTIAYLDTKRLSILKFIPPLTILGLLASIYFIYLQIFVIKQLCEYCLISAGTSTGLFITGFIIRSEHMLKSTNKKIPNTP